MRVIWRFPATWVPSGPRSRRKRGLGGAGGGCKHGGQLCREGEVVAGVRSGTRSSGCPRCARRGFVRAQPEGEGYLRRSFQGPWA